MNVPDGQPPRRAPTKEPPLELARERKPLRVLHLVPTLAVGGAERIVALLARQLRGLGHAVGVVSMYDPFGSWIEAELRSQEIPVHYLGKRAGLDIRMIPRIARTLGRFRPDVVHTHLYALRYALPALAISRPWRIVHTVHNLAEHEASQADRVVQNIAFRAGVIPVAIGDAVAESMRRVYRLSPPLIIPNGISVSDYTPSAQARHELRASLLIPPESPTLVSVGRLDPQKNTAALIRAFASHRLGSIGAHLLLAGDGALRRDLERQAHQLGIAERVHFLGVRDDIPRVLASADVFVLTSRYEGNPLTVMEAMAARKPVVATAVGCVQELVPNEAGRLIPPGDESGLESAMFALATDLPLARRMGAAAARIARARFDASIMARAYERLYTNGG